MPEHLRGVFTMTCYTNPHISLPVPVPNMKKTEHPKAHNEWL